MRHKSVPNYSKWIKKARASRRGNIAACAVGCALAAAGAALAFGTDYRMPALLGAAAVILLLAGLMAKNIREARAVMDIARSGNYAVMLSASQQHAIAAQQRRRGQCFYLAAFLVVATPEAILLTVLSQVMGQELLLLLMGGVTLGCFLLVFIASLYLTARLSAKDSFCTVSPHGILVGREVLPFGQQDALSLLKFSDYYLLRFRKTEIFGITHKSEIIIPTDGAVRDGVGRSADEEMVHALGLEGLFATSERWYESRDYGERDSIGEEPQAAEQPFLTDEGMDALIEALGGDTNKTPPEEEK